jgi:hypothetical protein
MTVVSSTGKFFFIAQFVIETFVFLVLSFDATEVSKGLFLLPAVAAAAAAGQAL